MSTRFRAESWRSMTLRIPHAAPTSEPSGAAGTRGRPNTDPRVERGAGVGEIRVDSFGEFHEALAQVRRPGERGLATHALRKWALEREREVAEGEAIVVGDELLGDRAPEGTKGLKAIQGVAGVRREHVDNVAKGEGVVNIEERSGAHGDLRVEDAVHLSRGACHRLFRTGNNSWHQGFVRRSSRWRLGAGRRSAWLLRAAPRESRRTAWEEAAVRCARRRGLTSPTSSGNALAATDRRVIPSRSPQCSELRR